MKSRDKLEFVKAETLDEQIRAAIREHGGNLKTWSKAASKIPDFPKLRTLHLWRGADGYRDSRNVSALRLALRLRPI